MSALVLAPCAARLDPQSLVDKLRIFGVRAQPPEAAPGTSVHIDALWTDADPNAMGRPIFFAWLVCTGATEDPRNCSGPGLTTLAFGDGVDQADYVVPLDALDRPACSAPTDCRSGSCDTTGTGTCEPLTLALVLLVMCPGGMPTFSDGGIGCPAGSPILAFKRIAISNGPAPNVNPAIDTVSFDGAAWAAGGPPATTPVACAQGCPTYRLQLDAAPGAAQTCSIGQANCPTGVEALLVSWFATGGSFARVRSDVPPFGVDWTAPAAAGAVTFWFVLRDGRGGVDWRERTLTVGP